MTEAESRKNTPVFSGVIAFFPRAIQEVARVSLAGNKQYKLGELHFDIDISPDDADAGLRHAMDHATGNKYDKDGIRHLSKKAWRALAELERELIKEEHAQ